MVVAQTHEAQASTLAAPSAAHEPADRRGTPGVVVESLRRLGGMEEVGREGVLRTREAWRLEERGGQWLTAAKGGKWQEVTR